MAAMQAASTTVICMALSPLWPALDQARHERDDEEHQEYEKQYLRDFCGASGDATESKHGSDDRNYEKNNGVAKHG